MSGSLRGASGDEGGAAGRFQWPGGESDIGNIQRVIGSGTLTKLDGAEFQVKAGDPVCQGDVIETEADSQIAVHFIDDTVVNLSSNSRVELNEFFCDGNGTLQSGPFDVARESFAFKTRQVAKSGLLAIDAPVASIRARGLGTLSLAGLTFAIFEEARAQNPNGITFLHDAAFLHSAAVLDDGIITYKDLHFGIVELAIKGIPGFTYLDNQGESLFVKKLGSDTPQVSVVQNTPADIAKLQTAQQDALAAFVAGQLSGLPGTASHGSSTPPPDLFAPTFFQPINFIQPDSRSTSDSTISSTTVSVDFFIPFSAPPTASAPATLSLNEGAHNVPIAGVSVGSPANMVTTILEVSNGTLHVGSLNGVTISGDNSATLIVSGAALNVNFLLASLTYTPTPEYGSDTLKVSITSAGTISTASTTIVINDVPDPPVISIPAALTTVENVSKIGLPNLHVASPDPGTSDDSDTYNVTLVVQNGSLAVGGSHAGLTGTFTGASIAFSGTLADVNKALADNNISYSTLVTQTVSIAVNGIADTPILGTPASISTSEDHATAISGLSVNVASADGAADTFTATLYVENGALSLGSDLAATVSGGDGHNLASAVVIVGSLAAVNAALATVSYTPGTEDGGSDTLHFSSTSTEEPSVGGDISSVAATTVSITVTIAPETVTANNDVVTTVDDETPLVVSAAAGVLSNDVHDADDTLHVSKVNGSAANVGTQITLSSGAHLTLNADGSYTYDPSTMANIATGKAFHDSFTYTATDGHGDTSTATVTVTVPDSGPTGVTFNIDPATDPHSAVNANDSQLSFGELIGSFSAIGDTGDTFTYELGSAVTGFELTSAGQLYAADGDGDPTDSDEANEGHVGVGTYTLDVIATDQEGISSPATSYTVVVGDKQNNSINLGNGNQIAFGLDGNYTIAAVSGNAVLVGGSGNDVLIGGNGNNVLIGGLGADTMTGGGVSDTFVFNAIADSQPGSRFDTITNFNHGADHIDFAAINGLNSTVQAVAFNSLAAPPGAIAAHTIDIVTSGSNTVIYANASGSSETLTSADMEIHLTSVMNVTPSDFVLDH